MSKVLVVATSHKTRGGITAVVNAHKRGNQWEAYHCRWIKTHIDTNIFSSVFYLVQGWFSYLIYLPSVDIVHFHLSEPISAIRKCLFFPFARLLRKKIVIHFHAFSPQTTIYGRYSFFYKYLFTRADRVVVLSAYWQREVCQAFPMSDSVQVIYNPCTAQISHESHPSLRQILYAGTINARKGYKDLIRAFSRISPQFPDWRLVFAGNGEIEQGIQLCRDLDIFDKVTFTGWIHGKEKDRVFKQSSVFCLPSHAEGFPMAVLDAWSYGLPVITTPVGGIPDIAVDGVNMLLFKAGDIDQLAEKLSLMLGDGQIRRSIADASIDLSSHRFNIETINQQIADLYSSLLTNNLQL